MNYYREISFPVCASLQALPAPFTFVFSPFAPSLQLLDFRWLEIPLSSQPPLLSSLMGEAKQGVNLALKEGGRGQTWEAHSFICSTGRF